MMKNGEKPMKNGEKQETNENNWRTMKPFFFQHYLWETAAAH